MARLHSLSVRILGPSLVVAVLGCSSGPRAPAPPPASSPPLGSMTRGGNPGPGAQTADQAFDAFAQRFLDAFLQRQPTLATHVGDHRFDAAWPDVSAQGEASYRAWLEDTRAALAKLPRDGLSEQNQIDAAILDDQLRFGLFTLDELKVRESDPVSYTTLISVGLDRKSVV